MASQRCGVLCGTVWQTNELKTIGDRDGLERSPAFPKNSGLPLGG